MSVESILQSKPRISGFALVISNDYVDSPGLSPIHGTEKDGEVMRDAFAHLNIAVLWKKNLSQEETIRSILEVTNCTKHPATECSCIAFVFSGHGNDVDGGKLFTQDGRMVAIRDIIRPFLPKNAPHIGNVPKLFFIDACRGCKEVEPVAVPKGRNELTRTRPGTFGAARTTQRVRGATVLSQLVPGEGNFLLAYSTMHNYQAYEMAGRGGLWMTTLARKLRSSRASIDDILTEVNEEMLAIYQAGKGGNKMQQPEKISRLNKKVFLHLDRAPEVGMYTSNQLNIRHNYACMHAIHMQYYAEYLYTGK